jgi:nucleoside-diphosphate-sugar epimerase
VRALVTGAAGFVGSSLSEELVASGHEVVGVDCFSDYYDPAIKRRNIGSLVTSASFHLVEADLRTAVLDFLDPSIDVVFHQASQPGVRGSWGERFETYLDNNVLATQRLLERAVAVGTRRFIYASSSSIYGRTAVYPTPEDTTPAPYSPYGVTKLGGELLCALYATNHGLSTVSLRYFTVYGPRQRPDMAMSRLISAARGGPAFPVYGDGLQIRTFTYVADVVAANVLASEHALDPGTVLNVAGNEEITLNELIALVEKIVGAPVPVERLPGVPGDLPRNGGDTTRIRAVLGWEPRVALGAGIERQAASS